LAVILTLSKLLQIAYSATQKLSGHSPSSSGRLRSSLQTVLDHLFHLARPSMKDLGQNLFGCLELQ
jgi:hypothetical protein